MSHAAKHMKARAFHGKLCPYCARTMDIDDNGLRPTIDHIVPRSQNGRKKLYCCHVCNAVKRDMTPELWMIYRGTHPNWWLGSRAQRALRNTCGVRNLNEQPVVVCENIDPGMTMIRGRVDVGGTL